MDLHRTGIRKEFCKKATDMKTKADFKFSRGTNSKQLEWNFLMEKYFSYVRPTSGKLKNLEKVT